MAGPGGSEVGRVAIRVVPATDTFTKELSAYLRRVEAELRVDIPTTLDLTGFKEDLRKLEVESKLAHPKVKVDVDVDKSVTRDIENVAGKLGVLQKAANVAGDAFDGIAQAGAGALGTLGKIPPVAVGIGAALALAAPLAADLAVSLGPGLLAAVPAVLGAGAALGVVALSMGKLKTAFKPIVDGFKGMEDSIGSALTRGVRPLVQELAVKALPTIKQGLTGVARVMNGFLKDFLTWAASSGTVKLIGQVFDGLASSMKPLGGAATAFADAVLRIAKDAAPGLKLVTDTIKSLAVRFDNFIKSKDKDGSLTKTITDSIKAAGDLIGALVRLGASIGSLFASIGRGSTATFTDSINGITAAIDRFNAGGGGAKIRDALIRIGQAVAQYLASGEVQRTIADFREFARTTTEVLGPLAALIRGIKSLGDGIRGIPGGGLVLDSFAAAISPLTAAIRSVNSLQTDIPSAWDRIKSATATAWAAITGFVSSAWATITSTLSAAAATAVGAVKSAWGSVTGFFSGLWAGITSGVSSAWATIVSTVSGWGATIAGVFQSIVGVIKTLWSNFWSSSFGQLVVAVFRFVLSVINLNWTIITGVFKLALAGILLVLTTVWNTIKTVTSTVWGAISGTLSSWWNTIKTTVSGAARAVWGYVKSAWDTVARITSQLWSTVWSTISGWWGKISGTSNSKGSEIWSTVSSWFSKVWHTISDAFKSAYDAVVKWIGNILTKVSGIGAQILSAVAGFGTLLVNSGVQLIQGLINGITSKINAVTDAVNGIAQKIKDFFPGSPVKTGPLTSWNNGGAGKKLIDLLIKGLTGSQTQVAAAAASVGDTIQKAVAAYLNEKSSLAKKIAADAAAVDKARQAYANVVRLHGITAANAINSARDSVANASAKLAADKSRGASAAAIRRDADLLGQAQARLQAVIKTQGTRTAIAVTNAREALQKAIAKLAGDKTDLTALNKSFGALGDPKVVALVAKVTKNYEGVLAKIAAARENLADRLKDAQSKLADAMKVRDDYAQSVRQATIDFANLTRAQAAEGQVLTSQDVITNLRQKLAAINDFRKNIAALRAEGLSNDALKQLVDAGVEAGGATALALVQGGQAAVSEVNNLTAQIGSAADDLGTTTARQFFQAGVDQAQALVSGLQGQAAALESQAAAIAQQMVNAIKAVFASASYDYGFHDKIPVIGGAGAKATPPVQVTVNNPTPETASQSTTRIMRSLATFGAGAPIYVPAR